MFQDKVCKKCQVPLLVFVEYSLLCAEMKYFSKIIYLCRKTAMAPLKSGFARQTQWCSSYYKYYI